MAILFAFLSLLGSAFNDLMLKAYSGAGRSRGLFVSIVGLIWLLTVVWQAPGVQPDGSWSWGGTLLWGGISGFCSVGGNILLLLGMAVLPAGVCATIYRLNLVPVTLGAVLLLGERLSLGQALGILCALAAILIMQPAADNAQADGDSGRRIKTRQRAFMLLCLAALLRAGMGLSYRHGFTSGGASREWVVIINALFWVAGGIVYAIARERRRLRCDRTLLLYGSLSGLLVAAVVVTMALSTQYGNASLVLPIAQMSFLATALIGAPLFHERITARTAGALALGASAVILICLA